MTSSSLFIPRVIPTGVEKSFVEVFIAIAFQQQKVCEVSRVDVVHNKTSPKWYSAFVHVDRWYQSSKGKAIYNNLVAARNSRLYYAPNKYWYLLQNTSVREASLQGEENMAAGAPELSSFPPPPPLMRSTVGDS